MYRDYRIGSLTWPGLAKVAEEINELAVVLNKVIGVDGEETYFDGSNLREAMIDEVADVLAALDYFIVKNDLPREVIADRRIRKYDRHNYHHDMVRRQLRAPA